MKALVTGGGGFLGRAIVEMLLNRSTRVRILSRKRYPILEALGAEGMQGDIRNADDISKACMGMDAVFHTAALPGIWGNIETYHAINVIGTLNVIEACRRRGVGKLVYTSSPSVVFDMKDENNVDEKTPYPAQFFNPYSQTKAVAEQEVLKASGRDGLLACAIRPHLIYGPRDNHLVPRVIERATRGKLRIVGKGQNKVDLTFVENAARAHLLACDAMSANRVAGKAYFVSDDRPVVLWKWINDLLSGVGVPKVSKSINAGLAYGLGATIEQIYHILGKEEEPPMTRFLARALSCSHYYNIGNAKRDFSYKPVIDPDEALQRTIEFFKGKTAAHQ